MAGPDAAPNVRVVHSRGGAVATVALYAALVVVPLLTLVFFGLGVALITFVLLLLTAWTQGVLTPYRLPELVGQQRQAEAASGVEHAEGYTGPLAYTARIYRLLPRTLPPMPLVEAVRYLREH